MGTRTEGLLERILTGLALLLLTALRLLLLLLSASCPATQ
jgi:hypothetical protein